MHRTMQLSSLARALVGVVCLSLLTSVFILAPTNPAASAQQALNEVCVAGTYVDGACHVRSDTPPPCESSDCITDVVRPSAPRIAPATKEPHGCPDGTSGLVDGCFIYVAFFTDDQECPKGSLQNADDQCLQPVANKAGDYSCDAGGRIIVGWRNMCVFDNDRVFASCPDGAEPLNGDCVDFADDNVTAICDPLAEDLATAQCIEPASLNPNDASACAANTEFVDQACVVATDGLVVEPCSYGDLTVRVLSGQRCFATTEPLVMRCPAGYSQDYSLGLQCSRFSRAAESPEGTLRCALGSLTDDQASCFVPAVLSAGLATCATGTIDTNGVACFSYESVTAGPPVCPASALGVVGNCYRNVTPTTCSQGIVFDTLCLADSGEAPVQGDPQCATSSTVFFDGESCYTVITPHIGEDCPSDTVEQDGECRRIVAMKPGGLVCTNPTHARIDGACLTSVPANTPDGSCPAGSTAVGDLNECRQPVDDEPQYYFCDNDTAIRLDTSCVFQSGFPSSPLCPTGFAIDRDTARCFRYEPATPGPAACPADALGSLGNCYIDVTPYTCSQGTLWVGECRVISYPPVRTEGECAVSSNVLLDGDLCYSLVDRDSSGDCPLDSLDQQGECRRPVALKPGPLVCEEPGASYVNNRCWRLVPADVRGSDCPAGSTAVGEPVECQQPVDDSAVSYSCPGDATLLVVTTTCVILTDPSSTPSASQFECEQGTRTVVGASGVGSVICIVDGPTTAEGYSCIEGAVNGKSCVSTDLVAEFVCPAGYTGNRTGYTCEAVLPPNNSYQCSSVGDVVAFDAAGVASCVRPTGPQPGTCPGVERDGQCYAFVDHTLACSQAGCLTTTPASQAAPFAERGDVNCDDTVDIQDALALAQTLSDTSHSRQVSCAAVGAFGGIRVTAADLIADGTVNGDDALQLVQCLVSTLPTCAFD